MGIVPWFSLVAAAGVVSVLACVLRTGRTGGPSVWDIQAELPHRAREQQPTIDDAAKDAHEHRRCGAQDCARRRAALRVLYEAGRVDLPGVLYQLVYERTESD